MRNIKKITAILLATTMTASLCACSNTESDENEKNVESVDLAPKKQSENNNATGEGYATKDETVYIITDGNGNVQSIKAVDWLKNFDTVKDLKDLTVLKDIVNIKGDESFNVSGNEITFNTSGTDIYYEGTADESVLPISMKITYKLDGVEMTAEELAGKSGHLEMNVEYTGSKKVSVDIDGNTQEVYVPFVGITAAMLDTSKFSNVKIDNGKVVSNGQYQIVCGIGTAGVAENFDTDELDFKLNGFTVDCDVINYENAYMMSFFTNSLFDDVDVSEADSLQEIFADVTKLTDASNLLLEGTNELASKVPELVLGVKELQSGISTLYGYTADLVNGFNTVNSNISLLSTSLNTLATGTATLNEKMGLLNDGVTTLKAGTTQVYQGLSLMKAKMAAVQNDLATQIQTYTTIVNQNAATINAVNSAVAGGTPLSVVASSQGLTETQLLTKIEQYYQATGALEALKQVASKFTTKDVATNMTISESIDALLAGGQKVDTGVSELLASADKLINEGTAVLKGGAEQASQGASQLAIGCQTYKEKLDQYYAGMTTLDSKVPALLVGVEMLQTGVNQLNDGMNQFVEEGINKITSIIDSDSEEDTLKVKAIIEAAKQYNSISDVAEGQQSEVKFVIKSN